MTFTLIWLPNEAKKNTHEVLSRIAIFYIIGIEDVDIRYTNAEFQR